MSRLKQKSIRMVFKIYSMIGLSGIILSFFVIYLPQKEQAAEKIEAQHNYIVEQTDAVLQTAREFANYAAYSQNVLSALDSILENPQDPLAEYELASSLYYLAQVKGGVRSIVIGAEGIPDITSLISPSEQEMQLFCSDWYQTIKNSAYTSGFSDGIYAENDNGNRIKVIAYSKHYTIRNKKFLLTVFYNYNELFGVLDRYKAKVFSESSLLNSRRHPLFAMEEGSVLKKLLSEKDQNQGNGTAWRNSIFIQKSLLTGSYTSAVYLSPGQFYGNFVGYVLVIMVLLFIFLGVTLFIILRIIDKITSPIYQLSESMKYAVHTDLTVQAEFCSDDEIGDLRDSFNRMMCDIKKYVSAMILKEEKEQEMRFGLLISQVDPHFICNTLSTINYLVKQDRKEDSMIVSTALSSMLRDRLRLRNFQIYDTVLQEVETVKQYLTIQKYRYGDGVHVEWIVEKQQLNALMPKNIIQPLVENSLFHGLADEDTGEIAGRIEIHIQKDQQGLVISVRDNGRGMEPEKIREIYSMKQNDHENSRGHGIGIHGVMERLEILYRDDFKFEIESEAGKGVLILIKIGREIE